MKIQTHPYIIASQAFDCDRSLHRDDWTIANYHRVEISVETMIKMYNDFKKGEGK